MFLICSLTVRQGDPDWSDHRLAQLESHSEAIHHNLAEKAGDGVVDEQHLG